MWMVAPSANTLKAPGLGRQLGTRGQQGVYTAVAGAVRQGPERAARGKGPTSRGPGEQHGATWEGCGFRALVSQDGT